MPARARRRLSFRPPVNGDGNDSCARPHMRAMIKRQQNTAHPFPSSSIHMLLGSARSRHSFSARGMGAWVKLKSRYAAGMTWRPAFRHTSPARRGQRAEQAPTRNQTLRDITRANACDSDGLQHASWLARAASSRHGACARPSTCGLSLNTAGNLKIPQDARQDALSPTGGSVADEAQK